MGKQLNYWMDYDSFLQVAKTALDSGCIIVREDNELKKVLQSNDLAIVVPECKEYYFYLPAAGQLMIKKLDDGREVVDRIRAGVQVIIEAGYSYIKHDKKVIRRNRIYVASGYYDDNGNWIERGEELTKVYNKIARTVKKVAPYTELTDKHVRRDDLRYLEEFEYKHKEYVTPVCLRLRNDEGYKLG